jgi:prolipoprotein diacylglyceryltransferase
MWTADSPSPQFSSDRGVPVPASYAVAMILGEESATFLATIPSPARGVWHIGPIPLRAYAICIIAGILVAVWLTERRWVQRGGKPGAVAEIATWALPFGIVGGRLYHVATSW